MQVIYLDQNHWIHLARAWKAPGEHEGIAEIGAKLSDAVSSGKICVPLTATNIYETYKIYDPMRREDLALVQTSLSGGKVVVGRHERLTQEIGAVISNICDVPFKNKENQWFLSDLFFEAFAEHGDERIPFSASEKLLVAMQADPRPFLFDYLMNAPDEERQTAVQAWTKGSDELRQPMERRRANLKDEPVNLKRRAYSAALLSDEYEIVLRVAKSLGVLWENASDWGAANSRRLIRETPVYHVECELALRLEAQNRALDENDFRDMASFCATVPYADCIIAEKQFINLTQQAGLGKHYDTVLATDLEILNEIL